MRNALQIITALTAQESIDWKIGLISTSWNAPPYLGFDTFFGSSTQHPASVLGVLLQHIDTMGLRGTSPEVVFANTIRHLSHYSHFLREGAPLAVIALTDTSEQSTMTSQEFVDELARLKGSEHLLKYYGAFGSEDIGCQADARFNYYGSKHEEAVDKTKGEFVSLCNPNREFAKIGNSIAQQATSPSIHLNVIPDVETLTVSYEGLVLPFGPQEDGGMWYYDEGTNDIVFHPFRATYDANGNFDISFVKQNTVWDMLEGLEKGSVNFDTFFVRRFQRENCAGRWFLLCFISRQRYG